MILTPDVRKQFTLVVDGNPFRGRGLAAALDKLGCYTAFVSTAEAALRYIIENEPDAVVATWDLPDMGGLELARQVTIGGLKTKVILQKNEADWQSLRWALECGGEELLPCSCPADVVLRVLERPRMRTHDRSRVVADVAV